MTKIASFLFSKHSFLCVLFIFSVFGNIFNPFQLKAVWVEEIEAEKGGASEPTSKAIETSSRTESAAASQAVEPPPNLAAASTSEPSSTADALIPEPVMEGQAAFAEGVCLSTESPRKASTEDSVTVESSASERSIVESKEVSSMPGVLTSVHSQSEAGTSSGTVHAKSSISDSNRDGVFAKLNLSAASTTDHSNSSPDDQGVSAPGKDGSSSTVLTSETVREKALIQMREHLLTNLFGEPVQSEEKTKSGKPKRRFILDMLFKQKNLENLRLLSKKWAHILGEHGDYEFVHHVARPYTFFDRDVVDIPPPGTKKNNIFDFEYGSILVRTPEEFRNFLEWQKSDYNSIRAVPPYQHVLEKLTFQGVFDARIVLDTNPITSLDFSQADVKELDIRNCPSLTSLIPPQRVEKFSLFHTPFTSLDLSQADVKELDIRNCPSLTSLIPPQRVESFSLSYTPFTSLDFSQTYVNNLTIKNLPFLTSLILQQKVYSGSRTWEDITHDDIHPPFLQNFTLENISGLVELDLSERSVRSCLRVKKCEDLTTLSLKDSYCDDVILAHLPKLTSFNFGEVHGDLHITNCPQLPPVDGHS